MVLAWPPHVVHHSKIQQLAEEALPKGEPFSGWRAYERVEISRVKYSSKSVKETIPIQSK